MYKKDKREMMIARLARQATFRYVKEMLRMYKESLVREDAKKIRVRRLRKLYDARITYMARSLMRWQKETEEAAINAGLRKS